MRVRPGVTLLEVLIAIFIMGIGLLALLTLFPIGATTMYNAMRDARDAEAGYNGKSVCFAQNIPHDVQVLPWYMSGPGTPGNPALPPEWNGSSYPVYVDAIGLHYIAAAPQNGPLGNIIPRTDSSFALTGPTALRWYSLPDDYAFDNSGNANIAGTGVERESQYTWAYMLKMPNVRSQAIVNINVVVYQGRNLQVPGGESLPFPVLNVNTATSLVIGYDANGNKPNLKRAGWILDVSSYSTNPALPEYPIAQQFGPVAGDFYRVANMTDTVFNNQPAVQVELQTTLVKTQQPLTVTNPPIPAIKNIMILDKVSEVFPVGTGWKQ